MRTYVGAAFALVLLAGTAAAQQPPGPRSSDGPDQGEAESGAPPNPSEEREGWGRHMDGHRHVARTKAASFRLEAGDIRLSLKCPDDEPMKACAEFSLQLLDRLGNFQRH